MMIDDSNKKIKLDLTKDKGKVNSMSKLQKALEKAKEPRGDSYSDSTGMPESAPDSVDDIHLPTLKIWEGDVVPEKVDRISPSYTQSRNVSLDPEVMERNRCVAMFPKGRG
jgi:non-specific protein-tyrosine kinase